MAQTYEIPYLTKHLFFSNIQYLKFNKRKRIEILRKSLNHPS